MEVKKKDGDVFNDTVALSDTLRVRLAEFDFVDSFETMGHVDNDTVTEEHGLGVEEREEVSEKTEELEEGEFVVDLDIEEDIWDEALRSDVKENEMTEVVEDETLTLRD